MKQSLIQIIILLINFQSQTNSMISQIVDDRTMVTAVLSFNYNLYVTTEGWSVAQCLWGEVRDIMNKANSSMKTYLNVNFGVREFHPMTEQFKESRKPSELLRRLQDFLQQMMMFSSKRNR